jgi:hypothetical protein
MQCQLRAQAVGRHDPRMVHRIQVDGWPAALPLTYRTCTIPLYYEKSAGTR